MITAALRPFHLAVPVGNLDEARTFYGAVLGCPEGRSDSLWVDFDLFGHQIVCHLDGTPGARPQQPAAVNRVDGHGVPVPHFGVVLLMDEWRTLAKRLKSAGVAFVVPPHIRFEGLPGEQATLFIADPSGNVLEFKGFRDLGLLFAKQSPAGD